MITFFQVVLFAVLFVLSLFMILIILLQRGKGGGLVGAFGGMGGQSAFGVKSSDVFLRITIVCTIIWFVLCIGGRFLLDARSGSSLVSNTRPAAAVPTAAPTGAMPSDLAVPADAAPTGAMPSDLAVPADAAPAGTAPADAAIPAE